MRMIDADELMRKHCGACDLDEMFCLNCKYHEFMVGIKNAPTIEPEVRHGRWAKSASGELYCPYCRYVPQWDDDKYCANCGEIMDGGDENG